MSNPRHPRTATSSSLLGKTLSAAGLATAMASLAIGCAEVEVVEGAEVPAVEAPVARLKTTPASLMRLATATFTFEADRPADFMCKLDGGSQQPCTSPYVTPALVDGSHVFAVSAMDADGNTQAQPTLYQWQIDSTMAGIIFSSAPAAYTNAATAAFEFSSDETMTFSCKVNGGSAVAATAVSPQAGSCQFSGLADGSHSIEVTGTNEVGDQTATYQWAQDRVRPVITKQSESKQAASYALSFTVSEYAETSSCTVSWTGGQTTGACPLAQGNTSAQLAINRGAQYPACRTYTITVNASDRAGNTVAVPYTTTFSFDLPNGDICPVTGPIGEDS